jgi:hypothetical protein
MRGISELFSVNHFIVSQTAPHVVSFLNVRRRFGTVGQLVEAELKHRCRQALELLPLGSGWPARVLRAVSQPWEGDVTIVLPDTASQLAKAIIGPTREDALVAARQGEVSTWAKLSAIQCNCGIESTMDECIQQLSEWERAERSKRKAATRPLKARLSSWAEMQALRRLAQSSSADSLMSLHHGDLDTGYAEHAVTCQASPPLPKCALPYRSHMGLPTTKSASPRGGEKPAVDEKYFASSPGIDCTDDSANPFFDFPGEERKSCGWTSDGARGSLDWMAP